MFWDKKEEKSKLPDLPPIRAKPVEIKQKNDLDEDNEVIERHELPSFPDSPIQKGFSQAAIKDAVSIEEEEPIPTANPKEFKTIELEDSWAIPPTKSSPPFKKADKSSERMIPSYREEETERTIMPPTYEKSSYDKFSAKMPKNIETGRDDVYIKIDKFYNAKKALHATKEKLIEVDELLKKIRETKLREEQELTYWEKEMLSIKNRVKEVTDNIFEKV